jgi:CubicO group peptidase (beta-lactamase class C family)
MSRAGLLALFSAVELACKAPQAGSSPLNARVDAIVEESLRDGQVPGLALTIVRNDSLIHSRGYGYANLEQRVPMTDSTPVIIGSTSKTITAAAIMQLVDRGNIALDTTVARYVRVLGAKPAGDSIGGRLALASRPVDPRFTRITTRHLLTNVAGIPAGFSGDAYDVLDTSVTALEDIVRTDMLTRRLDFAPGGGYRYSNRGFSLASLVLQDVSGLSYEDYVDERIFKALGMRHSTGRFWTGSSRGMAQGYRISVDGKPVPRPASTGRSWTGSGMILSTSRDAGLFVRALLNGGRATSGETVFSADAVAEMLRPQQQAESEFGGPVQYGLGWEVSEIDGVKVVMKGGSVGTMGSLFVLLPAQRTGFAMTFNAIDYGKLQLVQNVIRLLAGAPTATYQVAPEPPAIPASTFDMPLARRRQFAGTYETRAGLMRITLRGDTLAARFEGNDLTLEPTSDTSFTLHSQLREQHGQSVVIKPCRRGLCMWMGADSTGVRLSR